MDKLLIIIPIKQSMIKKDCFIRLYYNCLKLRNLGISKVLVADATDSVFFRKINKSIVDYFNFSYISFSDKGMYTPGILKNKAANYVFNILGFSYILFLDVDVLLNEKSVVYLEQKLQSRVYFDWLPVIFLGKNLSCRKVSKTENISISADDIVQVGYSSGIQLFHRSMFELIGGYNEKYKGYGCEDIEVLHKATYFMGLRNNSNIYYYQDVRSHDFNKLKGYRKFFYLCKKNFKLEVMPIHVWHKRKNKSEYLKSRVINDRLLQKEMINFDRKNLK